MDQQSSRYRKQFDLKAAAARLVAEREQQGLPLRVSDPDALSAIARLLLDRQTEEPADDVGASPKDMSQEPRKQRGESSTLAAHSANQEEHLRLALSA